LKYLRLAFRVPAFILVTGFYTSLGLLLKLFGFKHKLIFKWVFVNWQKAMTFVLNVKITVVGEVPTQPAIIMANHRSYVDVLALISKVPAVFVAKASVKKWPLIGWGGNALDTLWVERSDKDSRRKTRKQLKNRLEANKSVVIFPEGTTNRGPEILELKPGMFHTVADGGFTLIPLAIEYKDPNIAWVDDQTFIPHFCEQFSKPKIEMMIEFGEPIIGKDGDELQAKTAEWLSTKVLKFRASWDEA